jgi:hypothetical protein
MKRIPSFLVWLVLAAVVLSGGAGLVSQRLTTLQLRAALDAARLQRQDLAQLRQENEKLRARQVSPTELEALRADHAAVMRLHRELDALDRPPRPAQP